MDKELSRMVLTGEPPQKAVTNIRKAMGTSQMAAARLVMNEQAYFTSLAQNDAYGELDVEEYEFVGTLDTITCDKCGKLDGKHFPVEEMAVGINAPPMHPFCRCTTCPYFDDKFTIGKRASGDENGKTVYEVSEKMTYEEWKKGFVDGEEKNGLQLASISNTKYNKVRTANELKAVADGIKKEISNYANNPSRWSGKINIQNTLINDEAFGVKEWSCDISLINIADDGVVWHEMLHSCSVSHYDESTYVAHEFIEEATVEFLKLQICAKKNIPNIMAYGDKVMILQAINDAFGYGTDLEFAKELFNISLPDRYQWLEDKVDNTLRELGASFEDYNDVMAFIRKLKGGRNG